MILSVLDMNWISIFSDFEERVLDSDTVNKQYNVFLSLNEIPGF